MMSLLSCCKNFQRLTATLGLRRKHARSVEGNKNAVKPVKHADHNVRELNDDKGIP